MLESPAKRKKIDKKLPVVNLKKYSSILKSSEILIAISARKEGRQRLRQVTKWESSGADTANTFLQRNPGILDRS